MISFKIKSEDNLPTPPSEDISPVSDCLRAEEFPGDDASCMLFHFLPA